jgi:hypothetical protein
MAGITGPLYRSRRWGRGGRRGRRGRRRRRGHDGDEATPTTIHNHAATLTDDTTGEVWGSQSWSILEIWRSGELEYLFGPYIVRGRRRASSHFTDAGGVEFNKG